MAANHDHHDASAPANSGHASSGHAGSGMDYPEHERTFSLFSDLIAWGTVFSLVFVLIIGAFTSLVPWSLALIASVAMAAIVAKFF